MESLQPTTLDLEIVIRGNFTSFGLTRAVLTPPTGDLGPVIDVGYMGSVGLSPIYLNYQIFLIASDTIL